MPHSRASGTAVSSVSHRLGATARVDIYRAEGELTTRRQELAIAQTTVSQQENLLKNVLSRNGLRALEVPVHARARLSGTTSLTAARLTLAGARLLLALIIVPLRAAVTEAARD